MDLAKFSRWFDDDPLIDGYTGTALFKAQVTGFGQANVSETLTQRRTISMAPDLTPPGHAVVGHNADRWILGTGITDYYNGYATRKMFSARRSVGLVQVLTPGNAALGADGTPNTSAHAHFVYLKSTVNTTTDAQYDPFWEVYMAAAVQAPKGYVLRRGQDLYMVRVSYVDVEGFLRVEADQLDTANAVVVDFDGPDGSYDIVNETPGYGDIDVPGLMVDAYKVYRYATDEDSKMQPGEQALLVSQDSTTPTVNQSFLIGSARWRIWSVLPLHDSWLCRVRLG